MIIFYCLSGKISKHKTSFKWILFDDLNAFFSAFRWCDFDRRITRSLCNHKKSKLPKKAAENDKNLMAMFKTSF